MILLPRGTPTISDEVALPACSMLSRWRLVGVRVGGAGAGDARAALGMVESRTHCRPAAAPMGRNRLVRVEGGVAAGDAPSDDDRLAAATALAMALLKADDGGVAVRDELFEAGEAVLPWVLSVP